MLDDVFGRPGPFIKVCGMTREADIEAVNEAQPLFCGFVIDYPASHRSLSFECAEKLAGMLCEGIHPVGVFVDEPIEAVANMVNRGVITVVQLHGAEDETYIKRLRDLAPGASIIRAFRVNSEQDVADACTSSADMVLLDSGKGSGETFDWSLCREATRPFMLAGGLGPGNVLCAMEQARPWAVDMSSGLESDGLKDHNKIVRATRIVKESR